jgi:MSHA biogenesis protein MshQ
VHDHAHHCRYLALTAVTTGAAGSSWPTGTITGASTSSYVIGTIEHNIPNAAAPTAHFPVGDATHFAPVSLTFAGTTSGSGSLTVTTTAGDHPNIATSHGDPTRSVNRYWTIDNTTVAGFTSYDATFSFPAGELDGGVTTSALAVRRYTSGAWTVPVSTNQLPTSTTGTG